MAGVTWDVVAEAASLVAFLERLRSCEDEPAAYAAAAAAIAELGLDAAAVVRGGEVVAAAGDVTGILQRATAQAGRDLPGDVSILARRHGAAAPGDRGLLDAIAAGLALALQRLATPEHARLLAAATERQRLLEELLAIQRAISRREPLQTLLDAITSGASSLFGDEIVALRVLDPTDPKSMVMVSSCGLPPEVARQIRHASLTEGIGGWAIRAGELVTIDAYDRDPEAMQDLVSQGITAAMAAPVYENGAVIGSLIVGSRRPARLYGPQDQEMLLAFAEHASLALTDAHTVTELEGAFHDSLTGLPTRALFLDRLEHASAVAGRTRSRLALLFIDLDGFKTVNDSLGHAAGDELLGAVATRLRTCLRDTDTPARLGGDEFAVLLEDVTRTQDAIDVAERIVAGLCAAFPLCGKEIIVSASIGIAVGEPGGAAPGDLLRNADLAMYRAKEGGRGRFAVFEPTMHQALVERLDLEADLRRAVGAGEFRVHYQPVVRLDTERVIGYEALVRWAHPTRGMVMPATFVRIAEDTGLVVPLGREVLETACAQLLTWQAREPLSMSVNLSVRQLRQPDLVAVVGRILDETGCRPEWLILEITETMLMDDPEASGRRLRELKDLGVRLAIDDFGTGYSSLSYLRDFPFDVLKLDRSFVAGVASDPRGAALVRTILALGEDLALSTLAEGIESRSQLTALRSMGCRLGQGYLFARPLPASEILPGL